MPPEYPAPHITRIKILDSLIFLAGLFILAYPAIHNFYPGDIDTTVHVALGCLITVCAAFRVLVAYGSAWLEIVLIVLGLITYRLPHFMHMQWNDHYALAHLIAGVAIIALALISALLTFSQLRKLAPTPTEPRA